jgi:integral membrane sensor domain MASE1
MSTDSPAGTLATRRGAALSARVGWYVAGVVVIAAASFALAHGGKALLLTGPAGAFWPAGGFGIAVLYLGGLRWWPGVLLGDAGSLLWDVLSTEFGVPVGSALAEAAGDMARTLVAVMILQRLAGPRAAMDRLRDVGAVLVAVASGAAISTTVAMLALWAGRDHRAVRSHRLLAELVAGRRLRRGWSSSRSHWPARDGPRRHGAVAARSAC